MPENEVQDAQAQPITESKAEKFERERLTRRQALRKMGMTTAMATFALFSVDDLARMVGKAMEQRAGDSKVAEQIATEFQQAGIASFQQAGIASADSFSGNCKKSGSKCVGSDCLKDMPLCGCTCTQGSHCEDCCDSNCTSSGDNTNCKLACQDAD